MNLVTRRHLLRTAAVTAPLVATLPSGAIAANASSRQCAVEDQKRTPDNAVNPIPDGDTFVRIPGTTWSDGTTRYYRFIPLTQDSEVTVDEKGNLANTVSPPAGGGDPTNLLVSYQAAVGGAIDGVKVNPATLWPTECSFNVNPSNWIPPVPPEAVQNYCVYPVAQGGVGDNMGISASCLTSFVPG